MSRSYNMFVRITNFNQDNKDQIQEAAENEWGGLGDNWYIHENEDEIQMSSESDGSLCGGEGEEEFSERIAKAIWEANGGFCKVEVSATYLEDLPCETYFFDSLDYAVLKEE